MKKIKISVFILICTLLFSCNNGIEKTQSFENDIVGKWYLYTDPNHTYQFTNTGEVIEYFDNEVIKTRRWKQDYPEGGAIYILSDYGNWTKFQIGTVLDSYKEGRKELNGIKLVLDDPYYRERYNGEIYDNKIDDQPYIEDKDCGFYTIEPLVTFGVTNVINEGYPISKFREHIKGGSEIEIDVGGNIVLDCYSNEDSIYYSFEETLTNANAIKYTEPIDIEEITNNYITAAFKKADGSFSKTNQIKLKQVPRVKIAIDSNISDFTNDVCVNYKDVEKAKLELYSWGNVKIIFTLDNTDPATSPTAKIYSTPIVLNFDKAPYMTLKAATLADDKILNTKTFRIIRTGEAGGMILYENPSDSDGWKYVELCPEYVYVNTDAGKVSDFIFGYEKNADGSPVKIERASREIGKAKENMSKLTAYYGNEAYVNSAIYNFDKTSMFAVKACNDWTYNGFDDWLIPTMKELFIWKDSYDIYDFQDVYKGLIATSSVTEDYTVIAIGNQEYPNGSENFGVKLKILPVRYF